MTWITATLNGIDATHYYFGLSSLCGSVHIESESSYAVRIKYDVSYCMRCQSMLKSKKIHRTIQDRYEKLSHAQDKEKQVLVFLDDINPLEYCLLNIIHHSDTILPAKISELKEIFQQFHREIDIEDIILPLVTSKKVTVSGDLISPNFVEVSHVK